MASRKGSSGGATAAAESVAKFGISITVFGYVGVTVDTAATRTGSPTPRSRANARLDNTTAAPPSLVAHTSSRCRGSDTSGEDSTSSSVTTSRYLAYGLAAPWRLFFTLTLA